MTDDRVLQVNTHVRQNRLLCTWVHRTCIYKQLSHKDTVYVKFLGQLKTPSVQFSAKKKKKENCLVFSIQIAGISPSHDATLSVDIIGE